MKRSGNSPPKTIDTNGRLVWGVSYEEAGPSVAAAVEPNKNRSQRAPFLSFLAVPQINPTPTATTRLTLTMPPIHMSLRFAASFRFRSSCGRARKR
jgi:hypothetical protein